MPSAYADAGSMADIARDKARQHGATVVGTAASAPAPRRKEAAISTANDDAAAAARAKTRSWDYIWRSGVAGGIAGCAVSLFAWEADSVEMCRNWFLLTASRTGQNDSGASRSRQNPLPDQQSPVRKIHRLLVWSRFRDERHIPS